MQHVLFLTEQLTEGMHKEQLFVKVIVNELFCNSIYMHICLRLVKGMFPST